MKRYTREKSIITIYKTGLIVMIFNSNNIITALLIAVLTLFSGAVANAQKSMSPDCSTVQVQDTAKVPLLSPNYDDETEHTPLDNILPLSPQAASLARYGEYPVSHATGIPDITIPIYEIKLGDFILPISISYHASGIKVDDVASTVGLGWTLNAGGAVTRQVFGAPDLTGASNEYTDYQKVVEIRNEAKKNDTGTSMLRNLLYGTGGSNPYYPYDTQSDRYTYNFAGKSGMFRYSYTDNKFIPTDFSRMDIYGDTDVEGGLFRITDTNGYVYVFSCQEFSGVKSDENTADVSAWYLTEIKTPKGNIEIKYEKAAIYTTVYGTEYVVTGTFGQTKYHGANRIDEGYEYEKADESRYYISQNEILYRIPVVSSITWNGGIVRFHYSNDRKDVWKTRLTDIAVINMFGDTIKTANFGNDSYWGGSEKDRRMMLRSLYLSETGEYEFNYNTAYGTLPNYRTLSKNIKFSIGNFFCYSDYWGYYNGRRDHCSIPKELYRQVLYRYSAIPGDRKFRLDDFADRNPDLYYTKFGILTSITYPTGGQTLFEYENNDYDFGGLRIKSITSNGIERSFGYNTSRQMTDRPEQMMIYNAYHMLGPNPVVKYDLLLYENIVCIGTPMFPLNNSHIFYTDVTESFSNGEYIEYKYSCFPEPEQLCGMTVSARVPQVSFACLNDYGNMPPLLTAESWYDANGKCIKSNFYTYKNNKILSFSVGVKLTPLVWNVSTIKRIAYPSMNLYAPYRIDENTFLIDTVNVHVSAAELVSKETTDYITGITTTESYTYDNALSTSNPRSVTVENSDGKKYTTEYKFAFDLDDEWHKKMIEDYNMYDAVVETKDFCNGSFLTSKNTEYTEKNGWIYPKIISKSILGNTQYEKYRFDDYDKYGPLIKLITNSCDTDSVIWGYSGIYPTKHMHNGNMKTEYTWKPLCGVASIRNRNGYTVKYGYDNAGRLSTVSDDWGMKQTFGYNYSNSTGSESNTDNYVKTTNILSADGTCVNTFVQYADCLGKPLDDVSDGINEKGKFVHNFSSYDDKGRKSRTWLPVVADIESKSLKESSIAILAQNTYNDSKAYSDIKYDALDRNIFTSTPGTQWKEKGKSVEHIGNGKNDVRLFSAPLDKITLVDGGFYKSCSLQGEKTTDEDGHSITVFTDKLGRKVLERRNDGKNNNDTYFVYNDLGQLRYVLSPEYQNSGYKEKYAYEYRYDGRGNVVKKILPGCEYTQYWYDRGDRISFFQDAALRDNGVYRFFLCDSFGRLSIQGVCNSCNRSEEVNTAEFKENVNGFCNTGYIIPLSDKITNPDLETVNYYDNYTFLQKYSAELGSLASDFQVNGSCAQGLQTGKVQTANDGGKVIEVTFYDSKGQPADTRRLHVGKRLTCTHTDYSYTGKPTKVFIEEYSVSGNSKSFVVSQIIENVYSKKTDKLLSTSISVN